MYNGVQLKETMKLKSLEKRSYKRKKSSEDVIVSASDIMEKLDMNSPKNDYDVFKWIISNIKTRSTQFSERFSKQFNAYREIYSFVQKLPARVKDEWWHVLKNTKYTTPTSLHGWSLLFGYNVPPFFLEFQSTNFMFLERKTTTKRKQSNFCKHLNLEEDSSSVFTHPNDVGSMEILEGSRMLSEDDIKKETMILVNKDFDYKISYIKALRKVSILKEEIAVLVKQNRMLNNSLKSKILVINKLQTKTRKLRLDVGKSEVMKSNPKNVEKNISDIISNDCVDVNPSESSISSYEKQICKEATKNEENQHTLITSTDKENVCNSALSTEGHENSSEYRSMESGVFRKIHSGEELSSDVSDPVIKISKEQSFAVENLNNFADRHDDSSNHAVHEYSVENNLYEVNNAKSDLQSEMSVVALSRENYNITASTLSEHEFAGAEHILQYNYYSSHYHSSSISESHSHSLDVSETLSTEESCKPGRSVSASEYNSSKENYVFSSLRRELKRCETIINSCKLSETNISRLLQSVKRCEEKTVYLGEYIDKNEYKLNLYEREVKALQTDLNNNEYVLRSELNEKEIIIKKYEELKKKTSLLLLEKKAGMACCHNLHANFELSEEMYKNGITSASRNIETCENKKPKDSMQRFSESPVKSEKSSKSSSTLSDQMISEKYHSTPITNLNQFRKSNMHTKYQTEKKGLANYETNTSELPKINKDLKLLQGNTKDYHDSTSKLNEELKNKIQICLENLKVKEKKCIQYEMNLTSARNFIIDILNVFGFSYNKLDLVDPKLSYDYDEHLSQIKAYHNQNLKNLENNKNILQSLSLQIKSFKMLKEKYTTNKKFIMKKLGKLRKHFAELKREIKELKEIKKKQLTESSIILTQTKEGNTEFEDFQTNDGDLSLTHKITKLTKENFDLTKHLSEKTVSLELCLHQKSELEIKYQKLYGILKQEQAEASRQLELQLSMFCSTAERYREQVKRIDESIG